MKSDIKRTSFFGGGIDGATWFANRGSSRIPYQRMGATWPFARLKISKKSADFSIATLFIYKTAKPSSARVSLSKIGYLYFHTPNKANDFGFITPRIDTAIRELRAQGYILDDSINRNIWFARLSVFAQVAIAIFAIVAIVTGIIKSKGLN